MEFELNTWLLNFCKKQTKKKDKMNKTYLWD